MSKPKKEKKIKLDDLADYMDRRELGEDVSNEEVDTIGEFIDSKLHNYEEE